MDNKELSKQIRDFEDKINEMKSCQEKLKQQLIENLEKEGKTDYKDEYWTIYKTNDSEFIKFDEKAFQVADFQLYNKLISLYNKKVTKKGNYSWKKNN